jgi:hypothetical protein
VFKTKRPLFKKGALFFFDYPPVMGGGSSVVTPKGCRVSAAAAMLAMNKSIVTQSEHPERTPHNFQPSHSPTWLQAHVTELDKKKKKKRGTLWQENAPFL